MNLKTILQHFKSNQIFYYVIAALFLVLVAGKWFYQEKVDKAQGAADLYILKEKMQKQTSDSIINKQGIEINRQKALVTNNQDVINKITQENFQLKNKYSKSLDVIAYWKTITNTKVDSFPVVYHDTIPVNISNKDSTALVKYIKDSTITVPRKATIDTIGLSLTMTITKTNPVLDSLRMPDTLDVAVVKHKGGLFKRTTYEILSKHTNPLITSKKEQSLIYIPKRKYKLVGYLAAALAGAAAVLYLTK